MIRQAETSDFIAMDAVFRRSAKALCIYAYDPQKIANWVNHPWPERFIESAKKDNLQFVKIVQDEVIAFAELNIQNAKLHSLFVEPNSAGKGIGQELLTFIVNKAKQAGLNYLQLDSSLNAVNFYKRNGFITTGSQFTTQNGVILDSVQMQLTLTL